MEEDASNELAICEINADNDKMENFHRYQTTCDHVGENFENVGQLFKHSRINNSLDSINIKSKY